MGNYLISEPQLPIFSGSKCHPYNKIYFVLFWKISCITWDGNRGKILLDSLPLQYILKKNLIQSKLSHLMDSRGSPRIVGSIKACFNVSGSILFKQQCGKPWGGGWSRMEGVNRKEKASICNTFSCKDFKMYYHISGRVVIIFVSNCNILQRRKRLHGGSNIKVEFKR